MTRRHGHHLDTILEHTGRDPARNFGIVNPPVYHASTVIFPSLKALLETRLDRASGAFEGITYGREGTPTTRAFEAALTELEGGYRAVTLPCGLGAIATSLMAFLKAGDHLLMPDQLYGPARHFCDDVLAKFGVEVGYYDGVVGAGISALMKPSTAVVYLESPGSLTFEMQDVPAIARAAKARGATVLMDNTWASPIFFHPLAHGVDVVIHAATKYISGHSDLMLGVAVCNEASFVPVMKTASTAGYCGGPDDVYLALRGLRTLGIRMRRHQESALAVAAWLQQRRRCTACITRPCPMTPATASGSAIFSAPPACSASRCEAVPSRHSPRSSITWTCSSSATAGAATRASSSLRIHRPCVPARGGRRPALAFASMSVSRMSMT
jgi:cysteine-S-conjugate beta-lyase